MPDVSLPKSRQYLPSSQGRLPSKQCRWTYLLKRPRKAVENRREVVQRCLLDGIYESLDLIWLRDTSRLSVRPQQGLKIPQAEPAASVPPLQPSYAFPSFVLGGVTINRWRAWPLRDAECQIERCRLVCKRGQDRAPSFDLTEFGYSNCNFQGIALDAASPRFASPLRGFPRRVDANAMGKALVHTTLVHAVISCFTGTLFCREARYGLLTFTGTSCDSLAQAQRASTGSPEEEEVHRFLPWRWPTRLHCVGIHTMHSQYSQLLNDIKGGQTRAELPSTYREGCECCETRSEGRGNSPRSPALLHGRPLQPCCC